MAGLHIKEYNQLPAPFRKRITLDRKSGCWMWTGLRTNKENPLIYYRHKTIAPVRYAFRQWIGELSVSAQLVQTCRHGAACVNPWHAEMYLSTSVCEAAYRNTRFIKKTGCRIWQGCHHSGSPVMTYRGKTVVIRPAIWRELHPHKPKIQKRNFLRTTCGNQLCVAKEHLSLSPFRGPNHGRLMGPAASGFWDTEKWFAVLYLLDRVPEKIYLRAFCIKHSQANILKNEPERVGIKIPRKYRLPKHFADRVFLETRRQNSRFRYVPEYLLPEFNRWVKESPLGRKDKGILCHYYGLDGKRAWEKKQIADWAGVNRWEFARLLGRAISTLKACAPRKALLKYL